MGITKLLEFGYFPKELPPAFSTESFATKCHEIESQWKPKLNHGFPEIPESKLTEFTFLKKDYIRRKLSIPNPIAQFYLSKYILDNWTEIDEHYNKSKLSSSRPIENDFKNPKNKRSIKTLRSFTEFKKDCITCSYDKMFELKADISWFYPSIYTHSIPWALHTKKAAKENRNNLKKLYGNVLDKYLRYCQSGQTNGIPTGPDTSQIVAEIILCAIDEKLQNEFPELKGYRYFDDYYLYLSDEKKADDVMKYLQYLLSDFHLVLNEQKSTINKYPVTYDEKWVLPLSTFNLRRTVKKQEKDVWKYFNLAFDLFEKNKNDPVLKYAIRRLEKYKIHTENWDLFESLLLKCTLLDPKTIKPVIEILLYYDELMKKDKLKSLLYTLLEQHVSKDHSYELSWILWLAKTFEICIPDTFAEKILHSNDVIPLIIALDLKNKGLISSDVDTTFLNDDLNQYSLYDEKWILTYEAIKKEWISPTNSNILDDDKYFKVLKDNDISFYDENKQLKPIDIEDDSTNIFNINEPIISEWIYTHEDYD